jgi:thiamine transport system substrate-binding protein
MKILFQFLILFILAGCSQSKPDSQALRVYTHDSFVGKHALGPVLKSEFEARCGGSLEWVVAGDAGQVLQRLELDHARGKSSAHAAVGFDQLQWKSFQPWIAPLSVEEVGQILPRSMRAEVAAVSVRDGFIPYDFGAFGWIVDLDALKSQGLAIPKTWKELVDASWKRKLLLQDPRTSTPGFAALLTLRELLPSELASFLKRLRTSWLTLTPGWDEAYGLFMEGKAPLVWSYLTSEAYHRHEGSARYKAIALEDASVLQIEGAGLLKQTEGESRRKALCFLQVLLSSPVQAAIPERQWMWPARNDVPLPASFTGIQIPRRTFQAQPSREEQARWLEEWRASL